MKTFIPIALMLSIIVIGCEGKKKQYIPLQTVIQQNPLSAANLGSGGDSNPAGSNTNTTPSEVPTTTETNSVVVEVPTTTNTVSGNNTSTSTSTNTSTNPVAPQTNTTGSGTGNSNSSTTSNSSNQTTSSNSSSTPTSGNNISTSTATSTSTSDSTGTQTPSTALISVQADSNTNFTFSTTTTIPVNMTATDTNGNPLSNSTITISDSTSGNVLLQQVTNQTGSISGSITVPTTSTQVDLVVTNNNATTATVNIPLQVPVTSSGNTTTQPVTSIGDITIPTNNSSNTGTQIADRDKDGVDDTHDAYPDDPTKATKIRFPANGVNTIAFEDLYPKAGDADLNDYVIQFYTEEDLNAQGKIVEVRGAYQHVAKGAGYTHSLNLRLPSDLNISFETSVTDAEGNVVNTGISKFNPTATDLQDGLPLLGDSSKTISASNVNLNSSFRPGHIAKMKIVFNTPVSRNILGAAPYDIFIKVLSKPLFTCDTDKDRGHGNDLDGVDEDNTGNSTGVNSNGMTNRNENSFHDREGKCKLNSKTDYPKKAPRASTIYKQYYEVHFPGIYKDDEGKEIYLDTNGFPWAISIPGVWAWQLESKDIRKTNETGYPKFNSWASSRGVNDKDWYTTVSPGKVYSLPSEPSRLMAYLKAGDSSDNILKAIALIVFGSSIGLILRKKLITV